ncbi:MAG: hypothetical protein HY302_11040 [Opitutae bacterium]|nr:hypothetical protein [Opitutae bacterium]
MQKLKTLGATLAGVIAFFLIFLALRWSSKTALAVANVLIYRGEGQLSPMVISTAFQACKILGVLGAVFVAYRLGGRRMLPAGLVLGMIFFYVARLLVSRFSSEWLNTTDPQLRWSYAADALFVAIILSGAIYSFVKVQQKRRTLGASAASKTDGPAI